MANRWSLRDWSWSRAGRQLSDLSAFPLQTHGESVSMDCAGCVGMCGMFRSGCWQVRSTSSSFDRPGRTGGMAAKICEGAGGSMQAATETLQLSTIGYLGPGDCVSWLKINSG